MTDPTAVDGALGRVVEEHGALDVVVCTPGVNVRKPIVDYTDEDFDRVVDVNLKGSFHVLRAAGRLMAPRRRGSIILFSSIRAQVVEPGQSVYASTKAGIVQFTKSCVPLHESHGVRVNCVCPGPVQTPMLERGIKDSPDPALTRRRTEQTTILGRLGQPGEIANVVYFLASDEASFITGSAILADGGVTSKAT